MRSDRIKKGVSGLLHTARATVTGKTRGENVAGAEIHDEEVVHTLENAYPAKGGPAVLFGGLAPEGSVVKTGAVDPKMREHSGPARVLEGHDEAVAAIEAAQIHPRKVVIIRYEGPAEGPGIS
jgi:dihydroxy-acid dehydratase